MLLWFVGPSILVVWAVFGSPSADYRIVAAGSLVALLELPFGEPRLLHSVLGAVVVLAVVMVGARGHRLVQRQLLGLPVGMLLHLVLDGAWTDDHGFWWPFIGTSWSTSDLPELGRGGFTMVLELVGAGCCWWGYRRFKLDEPERREAFLRSGRIGRDVAR
ncbi:MAG: metal-dependent hydrolase [Acidimicrobiales bacterium]|nr:metal-dependent hydrolase [Acidimicrobiales bacterium]